MEIMYCDNCGFQIGADAFSAGKAVHTDDGKVYCAKCTPLYKHTTTALQRVELPAKVIGDEITGEFSAVNEPAERRATKFYFCETCGKRITDTQLDDGLGRDKKLKGVYCKDCAVGVMTVEFEAIRETPGNNPTPSQSVPARSSTGAKKGSAFGLAPAVPASGAKKGSAYGIASATQAPTHGHDKPSERMLSEQSFKSPRHAQRRPTPTTSIIGGIAIAACVIVLTIILSTQGNGPSTRNSATNKTSQPTPLPAQTSMPIAPKDVSKSHPSPANPPIEPVVEATKNADPEMQAKADFVKLLKFEGLAETDIGGRVAAVEAFLKKHGNSDFADPARVVMSTLKKSNPSQLAPLTPTSEPAKPVAPAIVLQSSEKKEDEESHKQLPEQITKEKADLAEVRALRQRALDALRAKNGASVTLKIHGATMTGTIKEDPNHADLMLTVRDGPEMPITVDQLDVQDVVTYAAVATGDDKAKELRSLGLLFLAAGESAKSEDYFTKARDAGLGREVAPYLERIATLKLGEREAAALDAWKKAEGLFAKKSWQAAKQAYETLQREYAGSATLAANAELLNKRLAAIEETLGPPKEISLELGGGVKLELVFIPAGEFMMGGNKKAKEKPVHKVKISRPFYMGKFVVTQTQYERVTGKNPSYFKGKDLPVERVNFFEAEECCKKLSKLVGKTVRLPTEAEWEYACRAGTTTNFYTGDDDAALDQAGWFKGNSEGKTHPVGQKKPNAWGLYDMHGNVLQWCQDWWAADYYAKSPAEDPKGPPEGDGRVMRGGSWDFVPDLCRSCDHDSADPSKDFDRFGFRVVVPVSKAP